MNGQPDNLQAAAVVVEPSTGRVRAYYGGHDGTGVDYAGWYVDARGKPVGYGAHPPGQTMDVYTLAAALNAGISVKSTWDSPICRAYAGRARAGARLHRRGGASRPAALADATNGSLNVPFYAVAQKVSVAERARHGAGGGIDSMWVPDSPNTTRQRYDLVDPYGRAAHSAAVRTATLRWVSIR